jgi:hypothetical protein
MRLTLLRLVLLAVVVASAGVAVTNADKFTINWNPNGNYTAWEQKNNNSVHVGDWLGNFNFIPFSCLLIYFISFLCNFSCLVCLFLSGIRTFFRYGLNYYYYFFGWGSKSAGRKIESCYLF